MREPLQKLALTVLFTFSFVLPSDWSNEFLFHKASGEDLTYQDSSNQTEKNFSNLNPQGLINPILNTAIPNSLGINKSVIPMILLPNANKILDLVNNTIKTLLEEVANIPVNVAKQIFSIQNILKANQNQLLPQLPQVVESIPQIAINTVPAVEAIPAVVDSNIISSIPEAVAEVTAALQYTIKASAPNVTDVELQETVKKFEATLKVLLTRLLQFANYAQQNPKKAALITVAASVSICMSVLVLKELLKEIPNKIAKLIIKTALAPFRIVRAVGSGVKNGVKSLFRLNKSKKQDHDASERRDSDRKRRNDNTVILRPNGRDIIVTNGRRA